MFDLRGYSRGPYLLGLATGVLLSGGALYAAATDAVLGPPLNRVVAAVIGGVFGLCTLLAATRLRASGRPRRLVIDHEGIRLETERRADRFRVAWSELAGVGLVLSDRRRRRAVRRHRFGDLPPDLVAVSLFLDMVPVDGEAVRRHPELERAWIIGGGRSWRVWLGTSPGPPLGVAAALELRRPDLWRGQRSGSGLFG